MSKSVGTIKIVEVRENPVHQPGNKRRDAPDALADLLDDRRQEISAMGCPSRGLLPAGRTPSHQKHKPTLAR